MAGFEPFVVEQWIFTQLTGDEELMELVGYTGDDPPEPKVFSYNADEPFPIEPPCVIFSMNFATDTQTHNGTSVMAACYYSIRAVVPGSSFEPAKDIAARIHAVLSGQQGETADGIVFGCQRENPLAFPQSDNGVQYRHLGGLYRFYAN